MIFVKQPDRAAFLLQLCGLSQFYLDFFLVTIYQQHARSADRKIGVDFFSLIIIAAGRHYAHLQSMFPRCELQIRNLVYFESSENRVPLRVYVQLLVIDKMIIDPDGSLAGAEVVKNFDVDLRIFNRRWGRR